MFYCFVIPYQMIIGRCFGYHLLGCKKKLIIIVRWHRKEITLVEIVCFVQQFLSYTYRIKDLKTILKKVSNLYSQVIIWTEKKEEGRIKSQKSEFVKCLVGGSFAYLARPWWNSFETLLDSWLLMNIHDLVIPYMWNAGAAKPWDSAPSHPLNNKNCII